MPTILKCKDETGAIVPWTSAANTTFQSWRQASYADRDSPFARIAELFNVNHFVVSQARPYIAPFLRSDLHHPSLRQSGIEKGVVGFILRFVALEVHHRLNQLDSFGVLPRSIRRLLIDENIPGSGLTLVPTIHTVDLLKLLENPTKESLDHWILRGERSVWPAVGALKVRCAVEVELDRGYQLVRRRKPLDGDYGVTGAKGDGAVKRMGSRGSLSKRKRAASVGQT